MAVNNICIINIQNLRFKDEIVLNLTRLAYTRDRPLMIVSALSFKNKPYEYRNDTPTPDSFLFLGQQGWNDREFCYRVFSAFLDRFLILICYNRQNTAFHGMPCNHKPEILRTREEIILHCFVVVCQGVNLKFSW